MVEEAVVLADLPHNDHPVVAARLRRDPQWDRAAVRVARVQRKGVRPHVNNFALEQVDPAVWVVRVGRVVWAVQVDPVASAVWAVRERDGDNQVKQHVSNYVVSKVVSGQAIDRTKLRLATDQIEVSLAQLAIDRAEQDQIEVGLAKWVIDQVSYQREVEVKQAIVLMAIARTTGTRTVTVTTTGPATTIMAIGAEATAPLDTTTGGVRRRGLAYPASWAAWQALQLAAMPMVEAATVNRTASPSPWNIQVVAAEATKAVKRSSSTERPNPQLSTRSRQKLSLTTTVN